MGLMFACCFCVQYFCKLHHTAVRQNLEIIHPDDDDDDDDDVTVIITF